MLISISGETEYSFRAWEHTDDTWTVSVTEWRGNVPSQHPLEDEDGHKRIFATLEEACEAIVAWWRQRKREQQEG